MVNNRKTGKRDLKPNSKAISDGNAHNTLTEVRQELYKAKTANGLISAVAGVAISSTLPRHENPARASKLDALCMKMIDQSGVKKADEWLLISEVITDAKAGKYDAGFPLETDQVYEEAQQKAKKKYKHFLAGVEDGDESTEPGEDSDLKDGKLSDQEQTQ